MIETNKIYCEDCRITMRNMPNDFIDLTVTSPPYDNLRKYEGIDWNEKIWKEILELLFLKTKKGGVVVWICSDETINGSETGSSFKQALYAKEIGFNLHDTMAWEKHSIPQSHNRYEPSFEFMFVFSKGIPKTFNPIMRKNVRYGDKISIGKITNKEKSAKSGTQKSNMKEYKMESIEKNIWYNSTGMGGSTNDKEAFDHPAIFPEKIAAKHIYSWSNEGDLVYDPFMGSGTVAKMAIIQNRNYIGSELAEKYIKIANKRILPHLMQTKLI